MMKASKIKATWLRCSVCEHDWLVKGRAMLSKTVVRFVKVTGNVVICPRCHKSQGVTIHEFKDQF